MSFVSCWTRHIGSVEKGHCAAIHVRYTTQACATRELWDLCRRMGREAQSTIQDENSTF
jgi:hypothetical protein